MTEEDTFDRLRRIPFDIMIGRAIGFIYKENVQSNSAEVRRFLLENGWSKEELDAEWSRRYPYGPHSS